MAHRLTRADVEPALPILTAGRGWDAAVAAVNAARPGAPAVSERTIRRVMLAAGLQAGKYPSAPRAPGHRPRKPELTDAEFKSAIAALARHPSRPYVGMQAAARELSAERARRAGAVTPADVKRASISTSWLDREMRILGWRPAPPPVSLEAVLA